MPARILKGEGEAWSTAGCGPFHLINPVRQVEVLRGRARNQRVGVNPGVTFRRK
ncbi:MAG: hypothetical protein KJ057_02515 [Phycisphaerae bacterium]|nr:hypothetical protein [Planctomycetia bacterium]MCL4717324.1 hypothetical protein [Phycisphaerae bacterium]